MPYKNTVKAYVENGYFHIYNRGVEKRLIFQDREDYTKFLHLIKLYLSPVENITKEFPLLRPHVINNNLEGDLELLAFCLMPNHYHLLVKQNRKDAISRFMRAIITSYSMYFNKRYERVGPLFQSVFKAIQIETEEYLLHLSRYIHLNPLGRGAALSEFEWSSYLYYLGEKESPWLNTKEIGNYFTQNNPNLSYRRFVEDSAQLNLPSEILLEN
jgi:putative transposase